MNETQLSIGFTDKQNQEQAEKLAYELNLPISQDTLPRLQVTPHRLELLQKGCKPLYVDFNQLKTSSNLKGLKKQGLVQACKPVRGLSIVDATAGWGGDAAILAFMGAKVTMIERNPIMAALLNDGLMRIKEGSFIKENLSLQIIEAKKFLTQLKSEHCPDVIYMDPMHPERQKSALVKKDMQLLQQLIGEDTDVLELLEIAVTKARQRVVLKWPQKGQTLLTPGYSFQGKTVRFDVYPIF